VEELNCPKFDIHSDSFSTETACNLQLKLKMIKITLLAFNVQIKNILNATETESLAYRF